GLLFGLKRKISGAGLAAILAALAIPGLVTAESGERSLTIFNIHTQETVTAVFKRNGKFVQEGLDKLFWVMRDYRRNEATKMDPELIDLLWQVHTELGSREPIHLISGFRSRATNEMLRRTVGGQASESRHILGKAADVNFPDIPLKKLRYSALLHEHGGVGYYPTSAIPFVHIDTDRVRAWPRLPRAELALLFPSGSTRHQPADGGPLTAEDVRIARARQPELAQQVALFLRERQGPASALASADPRPLPRTAAPLEKVALIEEPQPVIRPAAPAPIARLRPAAMLPSADDRAGLDRLANLAAMPELVQGPRPARRPERPAALASLTGLALPAPPDAAPAPRAEAPERQIAALSPSAAPSAVLSDAGRFGWGAWVPAPAYDEEHPEEMSYRPFPIAPYLTDNANDPLMSEIVPHDVARTLDMLDQLETTTASLRFRPTEAAAGMLWAQHFTGTSVAPDRLRQAESEADRLVGLKNRIVRTSQR
ncbi:MAG: DUF882 domain-containing protein, partial [Proteobacteria bacterium]|nr:DUF882 domain-containing protein [Pseudomonadota bacterium]